MEIKELMALPFEQIQKELISQKASIDYENNMKQYGIKDHNVMQASTRPNKVVTVDENGVSTTKSVPVARLPLAYQKKIVKLTVAFLLGNKIQFNSTPEDDDQRAVLSMLKTLWKDCKLDYKNKALARLLFSECQVAELWYFVEDATLWQKLLSKFNIGTIQWSVRMRILAQSLGDTLYPYCDGTGDMVAFSRGYEITVSGEKVKRFDIYTKDLTYYYQERDGAWTLAEMAGGRNPAPNALGKIPVIYYSQELPDWSDVQNLIDRLETAISNFADTNDYFASPMIKVKGEVTGFASKGESGKIIQLAGDAEASYLAWEQAPDATKLEFETLKSLIHSLSQTPDIAFDQMKSLSNISGIALKLMFLDAHLKVREKEEVFGEGIQRRINLLKSAIGTIIAAKLEEASNILEVEPIFTPYLPNNEVEIIDMLSTATGAKATMTQKRAVELNPFVSDAEAEFLALKEEENDSVARQTQESLNV